MRTADIYENLAEKAKTNKTAVECGDADINRFYEEVHGGSFYKSRYVDYLKEGADWPLSECGKFRIGPVIKKSVCRNVTLTYPFGIKTKRFMTCKIFLERKACVKTGRILYELSFMLNPLFLNKIDELFLQEASLLDGDLNSPDPFYRVDGKSIC